MAAAAGSCPNCGAPIEFALAASPAKVCAYCRNTVVRTDRGLAGLGKVADLANTPSLIAVGDEATLAGRPFRVLGRVQLNHGKGPWDEYYVAFDHGRSWGWLAYAQGTWFTTELVPEIAFPDYESLTVNADVELGRAGRFRVGEIRTGRITSAEGELPGTFPAGFVRHYADLHGVNDAFATLDYNDRSAPPSAFLGWAFPERQLQVVALGPRSAQKVPLQAIRCPNCGGDVPALIGERSERLGCPYCGAVSDIATRTLVATQEAAREATLIPIGSRGTFDGIEYVCCALVRRGTYFEGELYEWQEFLLFSQGVGFRWLVRDPETGWSWVTPVNPIELDLHERPARIFFRQRRFQSRNRNDAIVRYVLGEVYWKCEVGERVRVADFVDGDEVVTEEQTPGEAIWSHSTPLAWPVIAKAFGLPLNTPGGKVRVSTGGSSMSSQMITLLVVIALLILFSMLASSCDDSGGGGAVFRGGGVYTGGK